MKTISIAAIVAASITSPVFAQDRSDWPESFTVGTRRRAVRILPMVRGGLTWSPRTLGLLAAAKSLADQCRTWRWFTPVMHSLA